MSEAINSIGLLGAISNQMADAVARASTGLVQVRGRTRGPATGIVVTSDTVLTADHVLERDDDLGVVAHDGQLLAAQLIARDPTSDLALMRVADLGITPATFVETSARVGQLVLAVGRPTTEPMASLGIVTSVGGPLRGRRGALLEQFVQTDAIPYPGFSGGALVDAQGTILALLTTGLIRGVAIGIPAPLARRIATTLSSGEPIKRGFLGISSQPVELPAEQRANLSQEYGLLLIRVEPGSPAALAGLMLGDLLLSLDTQPLTDGDRLQTLLIGERVGKSVPVQLLRGGTLMQLQVTIGQRS